MKNYRGPATLTFEDGTLISGDTNMTYTVVGTRISGRGYILSPDAMSLFTRNDPAILHHNDFRIPVHLQEVDVDGAKIVTAGDPL